MGAAKRRAAEIAKLKTTNDEEVVTSIVKKVFNQIYIVTQKEKVEKIFDENGARMIKYALEKWMVPMIKEKRISLDKFKSIGNEIDDGLGTLITAVVCNKMGMEVKFTGVNAEKINTEWQKLVS